jgi:hypothetical protein
LVVVSVLYLYTKLLFKQTDLKMGWILDIIEFWGRILSRLIASKLLLANESVRKECLSVSYFLMPLLNQSLMTSGLKNLWWTISTTIERKVALIWSWLEDHLDVVECRWGIMTLIMTSTSGSGVTEYKYQSQPRTANSINFAITTIWCYCFHFSLVQWLSFYLRKLHVGLLALLCILFDDANCLCNWNADK